MNWYRHHWYYVGGGLFAGLSLVIGLWGSRWFSRLQIILIYSWLGMLLHQFEEYAFPGGFQGFANVLMKSDRPDRYPFNAQLTTIDNVFLTYPFYLLAIIFPHAIWYGLIQVGQGLVQVPVHGIIVNRRLKTHYNPGMASNLLWQLPVGIYYIYYVASHHLASGGTYWIGFFGSLLAVVVLWLIPVVTLRNPDSPYPYNQDERYRWRPELIKAGEKPAANK